MEYYLLSRLRLTLEPPCLSSAGGGKLTVRKCEGAARLRTHFPLPVLTFGWELVFLCLL